MEILNIPILVMLIAVTVYISQIITPPKKLRLEFLSVDYTTAIKGIAMLIIMLGHCSGHYVGGRLLTPCGGIGVSLFLIASGYGLNESFLKHGLADFWKKRILRVWMPYALITLIAVPFCWVSWSDFWQQIVCVRCLYWFVPYVLGWYVGFWFLSKWFPKFRLSIMYALGISTLFWMSELQAEQALGFATGVVMSEHKTWFRSIMHVKKLVVTIALGFFLFGCCFLILKQIPMIREWAGTWVFNLCQTLVKFPLSMAIVVGMNLSPRIVRNPLLIFTGTIAYELYLVHFRFYTLIGGKLWPAIVLFVGAFLVSWIFHTLIIKINNAILWGDKNRS